MGLDAPFTETITIYIGIAIVLTGITMLVILFLRSHAKSEEQKKASRDKPSAFSKSATDFIAFLTKLLLGKVVDKTKNRPLGCLFSSLRIGLILLIITIGLLVMFIGLFIQPFISFEEEDLAAEVRCVAVNPSDHVMELDLTRTKGRLANVPQKYYVTGDRWFIRGDVIQWKEWLKIFGLKRMYRLTRLGGFFVDQESNRELLPSQYSLVFEEESSSLSWIFKAGYDLFLVQGVQSNTVAQVPEPGKVTRIYVSVAGLMLGSEAKQPVPSISK